MRLKRFYFLSLFGKLLLASTVAFRSAGNAQCSRKTSFSGRTISLDSRFRPSCHGQTQRLSNQQLRMHMGHSHSHDHAIPSTSDGSATTATTTVTAQQTMQKRRRFAFMVMFCAAVILGPPMVRFGKLGTQDLRSFGGATLCLFALEPVRRSVQHVLKRMRQLQRGIRKHSTPLTFFRNESAADRVTLLGGVMNLFLSLGKFAIGVTCHSSALVADAGHSLSDLFSDFVTLWAVQVGRLPPDEDHPYGHGKFEAIGSLFLSLTLIGTGLAIGAVSNKKLLATLSSSVAVQQIPGRLAMAMAAISVISKEWLFRVTRAVGERIRSPVVIANAWHHRSDAYSSILAVASIGLARAGLQAADAAAGLFVAAMICVTGAEILGESIKILTDTSNEELQKTVTALAYADSDIDSVVRVRSRQVGSSSAVDVSVAVEDPEDAAAVRIVEDRLRQQILEQDGVVEAEVRVATATVDGIACSALEQPSNTISLAEVESCVRDEILKLHPEVDSIDSVTVRFIDSVRCNVDVVMSLDSTLSIASAGLVAKDLRKTLQRSSQIEEAHIFLGLNM